MQPSTGNLLGASLALILLTSCMGADRDRGVVRQTRPGQSIYAARGPDLVVRSFQTTGPAVVNAYGHVEVPVSVVIANVGRKDAGTSKVCTQYEAGDTIAFSVPGQPFFPFTADPLAAGATETFSGILSFGDSHRGETISITAKADCCDQEPPTFAYCRVAETDEDNNVSAALSVALP